MTERPLFWLLAGILYVVRGMADETFIQDSFNAPLSSDWSWTREDSQAWRLKDRALEIRIQPGNLWGKANNAKNVLLRPVPNPGKDHIEIQVTVENRPTEQYEQTNLAWYYDDSHMVKLGQELVDGQLSIVMGREEADRTRTIAIIPIKFDRVQLRFSVRNNIISGHFRSSNAEPWKKAGECDLPIHGQPKISLHAYQGPGQTERWVRFTDFQVRRTE